MKPLYSIGEISRMSKISKRTLHYYDEINLFKPNVILDNGYRKYHEDSLMKLQEILFLKEVDFSLKEIHKIVNHKNYNQNDALLHQKKLLLLKKKRLEDIIELIDNNIKGEGTMNFKAFSIDDIKAHQKKYADETEVKYSGSQQYIISKKRVDTYSDEDLLKIQKAYDHIFKDFALSLNEKAEDKKVQSLVKRWQDHINTYYYPCNKEILLGLSQMYLLDEKFKVSIDRYGQGTTEFLVKAIEYYCHSSS